MQAIVQDSYGSAEVLQSRDIDKPEIGDDEVLVRVHAASIHVGDWILMTGSPFVMRLATGLRKPKNRVPGTDVAGTVEAVGTGRRRDFDPATRSSAGAPARSPSTRRRPRTSSSRSRPTSPSSRRRPSAWPASTALQLLRDHGKVQPGQKVLINGASGGVGTFAVQIAKALGAEVTGVSQHEERGAGPLDRRRPRHRLHAARTSPRARQRYDLILDNVGNHSMAQTRRALTPTRDARSRTAAATPTASSAARSGRCSSRCSCASRRARPSSRRTTTTWSPSRT